MGKACGAPAAASATAGNSENRSVSAGFPFPNSDMLKVATVVQQFMTELSEMVSEKDKIIDHYNNGT
jgi:hypothetical protein